VSGNGIILYNSLVATIPDGVCTIRIDERKEIAAWTAGIDVQRVDTDQGQVDALTGPVRLLSTAEEAAELKRDIQLGDKIEIKQAHDTDWQDARVANRFEKAGAIRLDLGAEFE